MRSATSLQDLNAPKQEGGSFPPTLTEGVPLQEKKSSGGLQVRLQVVFHFLRRATQGFGACLLSAAWVVVEWRPQSVVVLKVFLKTYCGVWSGLWHCSAMGDVVSSHLDEAKREIISGEKRVRRTLASWYMCAFTPRQFTEGVCSGSVLREKC